MDGPSTTLPLPQFMIPTAHGQLGPPITGQHGSPTAAARGHCHLPHNDQFPTPLRGPKGPKRVEHASLFIGTVQAFMTIRLVSLQCNMATMAI